MGTTVDDVHAGSRDGLAIGTADIAIKRHVEFFRGGAGNRERDAEEGVGAQIGLERGAIELEHGAVDA